VRESDRHYVVVISSVQQLCNSEAGAPMQGTMVERAPGRWLIRAFAGRGSDGKTRHINRTVRGGKRDAQRALAQLVADISGGQLLAGQPMTLAQLVERWLEDIAPQRTPRTIHEYRRLASHDILPALGTKRIDKLTARDIDDYYRSLLTRGLSSASVRRHHALLHASLGRAVKWGLIGANPDRASPPITKPAQVDAPRVEDLIRLIKAARDKGHALLATAKVTLRPTSTAMSLSTRPRLRSWRNDGCSKRSTQNRSGRNWRPTRTCSRPTPMALSRAFRTASGAPTGGWLTRSVSIPGSTTCVISLRPRPSPPASTCVLSPVGLGMQTLQLR
jgi:hypothetical protein